MILFGVNFQDASQQMELLLVSHSKTGTQSIHFITTFVNCFSMLSLLNFIPSPIFFSIATFPFQIFHLFVLLLFIYFLFLEFIPGILTSFIILNLFLFNFYYNFIIFNFSNFIFLLFFFGFFEIFSHFLFSEPDIKPSLSLLNQIGKIFYVLYISPFVFVKIFLHRFFDYRKNEFEETMKRVKVLKEKYMRDSGKREESK